MGSHRPSRRPAPNSTGEPAAGGDHHVIRDVGAPNLGICVDAGHCHLKGLDVAGIIRRCGPHFLETHFHDNFGDRDRHNPVGIGTIDWLKVILALHETGYAGEITFEQGDYVTNARNWTLFIGQASRK